MVSLYITLKVFHNVGSPDWPVSSFTSVSTLQLKLQSHEAICSSLSMRSGPLTSQLMYALLCPPTFTRLGNSKYPSSPSSNLASSLKLFLLIPR